MNSKYFFKFSGIFTLLIILFILSGCKKDDDDNTPPDVFSKNLTGTLSVTSTNTYPPWSVSTSMDVNIEKVHGNVTITSSVLNYSGEMLVDDDEKMTRSGKWLINPTAKVSQDKYYLIVDAHIIVRDDIIKLYHKNDAGIWILVHQEDINANPDSDLTFDISEALMGGAVLDVYTDTGSLVWTLTLLAIPN